VASLEHGPQDAAALRLPQELLPVAGLLAIPPSPVRGALVEQIPEAPRVRPGVVAAGVGYVGEHVLEVVVLHPGPVGVGLRLEHLAASLEAAGEDDLLAEVRHGIRVPQTVVILLDVHLVGGLAVEREVAAVIDIQLADPLGIGRMVVLEVPLEVRLPADPGDDVVLGAEGALQLVLGPVVGHHRLLVRGLPGRLERDVAARDGRGIQIDGLLYRRGTPR